MPKTVQLLSATSFSAGLRLDVDAFQLREGETFDCMNVDLDPRGGVALRKAVAPMNATALGSAIHSMFPFSKTDGTEQVIVGAGTGTYYSTGSNFSTITTGWTVSAKQRGCAFADALYIQNGTDAPRKWTGAALSTLSTTFNDDIASPNNGDMPIAKCIAAYSGYVWVANTLESGTRYGSRVRFSHPNRAEDWRTDDYTDVDTGKDGDEITALVPLADRLLVFKNRSLHMITGGDPDSFAVTFLANVGAPSQEAVAATEYGVYFFSWPEGLYFYGERGTQYEFDAIYPAIRNGHIPDAYHAQVCVGWMDRRVYVSVPWGSSTVNARTFVLTPGREGGWTQYDLGLGPMFTWRRNASDAQDLAVHAGNNRVLRMNQDADQDNFGSGPVDIPSYYFTRWFDAGSPAVVKRWRRPDIVYDADYAATIRFEAFRDYDPTNAGVVFTENITAQANGMNWGAANWGSFNWGASTTGAQVIERGGLLGRARSIALKITGPTGPSVRWSVNSINFKYIPRRVR